MFQWLVGLSTSAIVEFVVAIIGITALFPFFANALAQIGVLFTKLETGNIVYIYYGETLHRVIADVHGKKLSGWKLVSGTQHKNWLNRFGLYWIGFPPFARVQKFNISKKKETEELMNKPATEWIEDSGKAEVSSLRAFFPRPFLMSKVELNDRQTVTLLLVCMFEVADVYIPVPRLKGDFFGNTFSTLSSSVIDILRNINSMDDFVAAPKGEKGGILESLTEENGDFNKYLEGQVGLHLVGIAISAWEPSDPAVRKAMNDKFIAEREKERTIIEAEAYQIQVETRTKADTERIESLGKAKAQAVEFMASAQRNIVRATVESLVLPQSNPDIVTRSAAEVLAVQAASGPDSKLTTYVGGGNDHPVVVGGGTR